MTNKILLVHPGELVYDALDLFGGSTGLVEKFRARGLVAATLDVAMSGGCMDILSKGGWYNWLVYVLSLFLGLSFGNEILNQT